MDDLTLSVIVATAVFLSGVIGLSLHRFLPEHHLSKETQDVIRLGTGMLSVLASLVLSLLITTAKTTFDSTDTAVREYSADLIVMDETLREYGEGALQARRFVREYTAKLISDVWSDRYHHRFLVENRAGSEILDHLREAIRALAPSNHDQQILAGEALQQATSLERERWLLIERAGATLSPIVIGIVVCWICAIFVSFGMNAPLHATIYSVFLILALAIGSAMFLILEMDSPFEGIMRISRQPVQTALHHMLPAGQ